MPRTYVRKTTKASWKTEDLIQAINVVANKEMSMRKAAKYIFTYLYFIY
jgi:hypothetical protein